MTSPAEVWPAADGPEVPFAAWTEAVRRAVFGFRFDCDRPRTFAGVVRTRSLAGVSFVDLASDRHAAYRDEAAIAAEESGFCVLTLQLAGELRMAQEGRVALLKPGSFAVYDSSKPAALTVGDGYRSTCVRFPVSMLGAGDPLAGVTARAFDCEPGITSAVWEMLLSLNRNLDALGPHGHGAVHSVLELVQAMLRTSLGVPADRRVLLLERVRDHIEANLGDPALSPATVAAAHGISVRQLHVLFQGTGSTVSAWIRDRRLEHCRRDLADPLLPHVPVAAVAARWGFPGASHFGAAFKRATGQTPAQYRRARLG
ncbi:helix-turn-helix domain-containing protein [Amycolatopsis acidicola]|uniref:Helix-turn-helix domain-containing protein n=1 Tax=Amycolatopsis acidicola TaxID=2596893 RepID=A0A5N0UQ33_9PSEU|nr:helix-turn-helix domain-containing protein [Amycolatopsis acidicola]KAA9150723.1 helix-turn-helix domain-containing protein [Amycolatopsis acidicola]